MTIKVKPQLSSRIRQATFFPAGARLCSDRYPQLPPWRTPRWDGRLAPADHSAWRAPQTAHHQAFCDRAAKTHQDCAGNRAKTGPRAAYYHFGLAHMYEDMATNYGRPEYATRAIEEYKLALDADPSSKYLNSGLAELYLRTGRVRDAVLAAQEILKTEPDNLDAHKLLGRVYLQSLGNVQNGGPSEKVLQLAIAEYTKIVQLQSNDIESRLLLGQLYTLATTRRMRKSSLRRRSASIPVQKMWC
jgi:tetratricopeptide (TPR) repeat protein